MKITQFLAKICHFGDHFEFLKCSGVRRHHMQKRLSDSCSTSNLTMETGRPFQDLKKKIGSDMPIPTIMSNHLSV